MPSKEAPEMVTCPHCGTERVKGTRCRPCHARRCKAWHDVKRLERQAEKAAAEKAERKRLEKNRRERKRRARLKLRTSR